MSLDYGVSAAHRRHGLVRKALIGFAVLFVLVFGAAFLQHQRQRVADAQEWKIEGPPCPTLTAQAFAAAQMKAPKGLTFDGVRFARRFGHVDCNEIAYDDGKGLGGFPVCQFTGPGTLQVTTPKGDFFFNPGVGQPATVAVPHDAPTCVMASNFRA